MRITIKDLRAAIHRLNHLTNQPLESWSRDSKGISEANIGNYHLSQAYGGYQVLQHVNSGGDCQTPITSAHVPCRECYETLHAFIRGYETGYEAAGI